MNRFLISFLGLFLFTNISSFGEAPPGAWKNRANVVRAGQSLADASEHLDEALHDINADKHIIQAVHHFATEVEDFVRLVQKGCSYIDAQRHFNIVRKDMQKIANELNAHPELLRDRKVAGEWRHVRSAYRNLDNEMFSALRRHRIQ